MTDTPREPDGKGPGEAPSGIRRAAIIHGVQPWEPDFTEAREITARMYGRYVDAAFFAVCYRLGLKVEEALKSPLSTIDMRRKVLGKPARRHS